MTAGLRVPVSPFVEVPGRVGTKPPAQIAKLVPILNVGIVFEVTVKVNEVVVAHCPASGINVYVPEFWISTMDGLHVPVNPFVEVVSKVGTVPPAQMVELVPNPNVGVTFGFTVIVNDVVVAHWPASGVNV